MKVSIDAGERHVIIETDSDANLTHAELAATALSAWRDTACEGSHGTEGPAFGITVERAVAPVGRRWLGEGPPRPIDAST